MERLLTAIWTSAKITFCMVWLAFWILGPFIVASYCQNWLWLLAYIPLTFVSFVYLAYKDV